jgi:6-phosphogluconolactonase/glucosamine-6-phosphate isomerase/deaminase
MIAKEFNAPSDRIKIESCQTAEQAIDKAASKLTSGLETALASGKKILLLLSGGSNLKILDQIPKELLDNKNITIYVLDERFSSDPGLNNSLQIKEKGININLTVPNPEESLEVFASRFNDELRLWLDQNPVGEIISTLGMGPDGHMAGISPMPEDSTRFEETFNQDKLAIGYVGNLSPAERVTVLPSFLARINLFITLITGEPKRAAFESFVNRNTKPNIHPIQLLHQFLGKTIIFTDL